MSPYRAVDLIRPGASLDRRRALKPVCPKVRRYAQALDIRPENRRLIGPDHNSTRQGRLI